MTVQAFFYVLYLITDPDVLNEGQNIHRLAFEKQEDCLYMAHTLKQEVDPFARKQLCLELTEYSMYLRTPMPKPKGMP